MAHVFISYVRDDQKLVDRLVSELEGKGVNVWRDQEQLKAGQRWKSVIAAAIEEATHFVACFSSAYQQRDRSHVNEELTLAIEELRLRPHNRTWFLPVRLDDCSIPARPIGGRETLLDIHCVDLHRDWAEGLQNLLTAIEPQCVNAEEREKAELNERMRLQLSSEQRVFKATEDIRSKDPSTRVEAARELRRLRDPRTIPTLVETMSKEDFPTLTKVTVMTALKEFGLDAVPFLIDEVRNHASLAGEQIDLSENPQWETWRTVVLESDAGRLLVRIGAPSIPSLQELRNNEGWLGEAADALLTAIEKRQ
jgi:hypothetical protein